MQRSKTRSPFSSWSSRPASQAGRAASAKRYNPASAGQGQRDEVYRKRSATGLTTILGIETSCDETSAAIVIDGLEVFAKRESKGQH